jgi:hypothetical protein
VAVNTSIAAPVPKASIANLNKVVGAWKEARLATDASRISPSTHLFCMKFSTHGIPVKTGAKNVSAKTSYPDSSNSFNG